VGHVKFIIGRGPIEAVLVHLQRVSALVELPQRDGIPVSPNLSLLFYFMVALTLFKVKGHCTLALVTSSILVLLCIFPSFLEILYGGQIHSGHSLAGKAIGQLIKWGSLDRCGINEECILRERG
jgi:hypothetical protein